MLIFVLFYIIRAILHQRDSAFHAFSCISLVQASYCFLNIEKKSSISSGTRTSISRTNSNQQRISSLYCEARHLMRFLFLVFLFKILRILQPLYFTYDCPRVYLIYFIIEGKLCNYIPYKKI